MAESAHSRERRSQIDDLMHGCAIDRPGHGLAQRHVVEGRFGTIHFDMPVAEPCGLDHRQLGVFLQAGDELQGHAIDDMEVTGAHGGEAHRWVGDRTVDDLIQEGSALTPILRITLDADVVVLHPFDELEGPSTDRVAGKVLAVLFHRGARYHHP